MSRENAAGVALVLGVGVLLAACAPPGGAPRVGPQGERGAPIPAVDPSGELSTYDRADYQWTMRTLEGEPVDLEAFRGRVLFINMWASWCAPCVAEMGSIQRLRDSLRGTGVEFLLISPEDPEPVERFLRRYGYDLPILLEVEEMPEAFGLRALPTTFVVDRTGNIVLKHRGASEWDDDAVRAFLHALTR
jgi:thiol-disulfide isomerase/thioredoxin